MPKRKQDELNPEELVVKVWSEPLKAKSLEEELEEMQPADVNKQQQQQILDQMPEGDRKIYEKIAIRIFKRVYKHHSGPHNKGERERAKKFYSKMCLKNSLYPVSVHTFFISITHKKNQEKRTRKKCAAPQVWSPPESAIKLGEELKEMPDNVDEKQILNGTPKEQLKEYEETAKTIVSRELEKYLGSNINEKTQRNRIKAYYQTKCLEKSFYPVSIYKLYSGYKNRKRRELSISKRSSSSSSLPNSTKDVDGEAFTSQQPLSDGARYRNSIPNLSSMSTPRVSPRSPQMGQSMSNGFGTTSSVNGQNDDNGRSAASDPSTEVVLSDEERMGSALFEDMGFIGAEDGIVGDIPNINASVSLSPDNVGDADALMRVFLNKMILSPQEQERDGVGLGDSAIDLTFQEEPSQGRLKRPRIDSDDLYPFYQKPSQRPSVAASQDSSERSRPDSDPYAFFQRRSSQGASGAASQASFERSRIDSTAINPTPMSAPSVRLRSPQNPQSPQSSANLGQDKSNSSKKSGRKPS